jgi:hypothetical protein
MEETLEGGRGPPRAVAPLEKKKKIDFSECHSRFEPETS